MKLLSTTLIFFQHCGLKHSSYGFFATKNAPISCIMENYDQGRSYINTSIDISDCFFSRVLHYSDNGGVIYVSGGAFSLMVSSSIFFNCFSSSSGGAIYFSSAISNLQRICSFMCSCGSTNNGNFAIILSDNINHVDFLSIASCSNFTNGYYSIIIFYGNQRIDNTNSSSNSCLQSSGLCASSPILFTCTHCTISKNKVTDGIIIYYRYNSGVIRFSNLINNWSPTLGVIYVIGGSPKTQYCIFDMNQNNLFYLNSGSSIEVSHCFIYHSGITSFGINNSITRRLTYDWKFFNSYYCYAENPIQKQIVFSFILVKPNTYLIYLLLYIVSFE